MLGLPGSRILASRLNAMLRMLETAEMAHDVTIAQLPSRGSVPHFVGIDKQPDRSRRGSARRTTFGLLLLAGASGCQLASIFSSLSAA